MLRDKDPKFLSRTIGIIIKWDRQTTNKDIIHIHGNKDHTLPIKNVKYDYLIENGSAYFADGTGKLSRYCSNGRLPVAKSLNQQRNINT